MSFDDDCLQHVEFEGVVEGVDLEIEICSLGANMFEFEIAGENADLTGTVNDVIIFLVIGDDGGTTSVIAEIENG